MKIDHKHTNLIYILALLEISNMELFLHKNHYLQQPKLFATIIIRVSRQYGRVQDISDTAAGVMRRAILRPSSITAFAAAWVGELLSLFQRLLLPLFYQMSMC